VDETGYAQSQGIRLLNRVVETAGPLFTVEQAQFAAASLNLSPRRVSSLLSQLARAGWTERIKQGVYVVSAPRIFGSLQYGVETLEAQSTQGATTRTGTSTTWSDGVPSDRTTVSRSPVDGSYIPT